MPIFRSRRQAEVLALLFLPPTAELTLTEGTTQTYDGTPDSRSGTRGAALAVNPTQGCAPEGCVPAASGTG